MQRFLVGLILCAGIGIWPLTGQAHDPDALWKIVHGRCAAHVGMPAPCAVYNASSGDAVLHSIEGQGQYLLIPTVQVSGIESPALLKSDMPNYFAQAWAARDFVARSYGRPISREDFSLAINSRYGRSQNQLHIHIDCIRRDIRAALELMLPNIGPRWTLLPKRLGGFHYRAMWVENLSKSPFMLLAQSLHDPVQDMGSHTLVVWPAVSAAGNRGFVLLDDSTSFLDPASGEVLQDHTCAIANAAKK